ncbi:MAG: pentapeptide MXKDX repeat protein [Rhodospirillaceae bacterium]|nr:pentapeptide MXKDX repeat protein [Rhodospirillaceae bacterium]
MFKTASTLTVAASLAMLMGLSAAQAGEMKKDTMMKKDDMVSEMKGKHAMDDKMKKDGMMGKKDDMMAKKDKMMGEKK